MFRPTANVAQAVPYTPTGFIRVMEASSQDTPSTRVLARATARVPAAHHDVLACLTAQEMFSRAAAAVHEFRAACEILDLEYQLETGQRLLPGQALDRAISSKQIRKPRIGRWVASQSASARPPVNVANFGGQYRGSRC